MLAFWARRFRRLKVAHLLACDHQRRTATVVLDRREMSEQLRGPVSLSPTSVSAQPT